MKKLIILIIVGGAFGLGYWVGQNPNEVKHIFREYSGDVLEKTIGLEESMALRREYLGAKEQFVEGKAHLLDHEYEKAAQNLTESMDHLESMVDTDSDILSEEKVDELMVQIQAAKDQLAEGKGVSRKNWDAMQRKLDALLP